jgi:cardiolipin-specific phospholipase
MDVAGGYAAEEKIKQRVVKALMTANEEERKKENGSAKVIIVKNAGHHLYLENPEDFNSYVVKELKETQEYNKRVKGL